MVEIQANRPAKFDSAVETVAALAAWKSLGITIMGYIVKVLWDWNNKPAWPRIVAGLMVCVMTYGAIEEFGPESYKHTIFFVGGLLTNNIVNGIFRWAKVNEQGLMDKTKRWWNSDKH